MMHSDMNSTSQPSMNAVIAALRGGGRAVAESLGGRQLHSDTTDLVERRVLNVVEEMAIASGTPTPPIYLLRDEPEINAFAAGFAPEDAVIGVTAGASAPEELVDAVDDEGAGVLGHGESTRENRENQGCQP